MRSGPDTGCHVGRRAQPVHPSRLEFPFPYRDGQRELAAAVYRTIPSRGRNCSSRRLRAWARPWSTMSSRLYGPWERGLGEKIFYLTAKTITTDSGREEAFDILKEQALLDVHRCWCSRPRRSSAPVRGRSAIRRPVPMQRGILTGSTRRCMSILTTSE